MDSAILREEEKAATEIPSTLKLLIKEIRIFGNNPQIREWWYKVMSIRPPPFPENEEKCREEILDRIEEGWQGEDWAINMSQTVNEIMRQNLLTTKTPPATRTNHEVDGIQWIRTEELGKALSNRCRAVRKLNEKRRKTQRGTIDRHTNSEQLEFEYQLKTPTRSRIHELLNLGASSSHNLFQSLITNQDLLRLGEDMWLNYRTQRTGWWCRAFSTAINRQCPTCTRLWTTEQFPLSLPQCLSCSQNRAKKKSSQFKPQKNEAGLIFRSALPEDLDWDTRAEDVALSMDAIKRCLANMLVAR